ncbi:MAG: RidA family protein [Acidimicrobiales bacterium]|nr:RidA family protein [Acidimicrobiales bacterium]MDP6759279.1 RidA family protein [Acidimicrobiales bacterium]
MTGPLPATRGSFPHARVAGDLVHVSGTSARRADDTIEGATVTADGTVRLDAGVQSEAVLGNVERVLAEVGLDRTDLVDVTAFLVDIEDFDAWNAAWTGFFDGNEAPARTTVGVRALPHPHLLVEVKATARLRNRG